MLFFFSLVPGQLIWSLFHWQPQRECTTCPSWAHRKEKNKGPTSEDTPASGGIGGKLGFSLWNPYTRHYRFQLLGSSAAMESSPAHSWSSKGASSLLHQHSFPFINGWFIGTVYCEEISLPDEGNKGKDCGRKGKRDISPSPGMYSWIAVIFNGFIIIFSSFP